MKKQTMRMLSVLLCVLITVSGFSVITAFAAETRPNRKADTVVNPKQTTTQNTNTDNMTKKDDSTLVEYKGRKFGTGDLGIKKGDNIPKIKTENQYYSILSKEESEPLAECKVQTLDKNEELPSKVDNSESKYMPPVGNQGGLGACVAWADIYYQMSYAVNKQLDRKATYENSRSPIWVYNFLNGGTNNGIDSYEALRITENIGVPSLRTSPNISDGLSWTNSEAACEEASKYKMKDLYMISYGNGDTPITGPKDHDLDLIKTALNNGELLTFATQVSGWKEFKIKNEKRVPENAKYCGKTIVPYMNYSSGGHRMTIVGYNDDIWYDINGNGKIEDGEKGAFKVVNSWGGYYGDEGYVWVSYDALNKTSSVNTPELSALRFNSPIITDITRCSIEPYNNGSNIYIGYTLRSRNRNEISGKITATNKENGETYSHFIEPFRCAKNSSDPISFNGEARYSKYSFLYDLSNIVEDLNSENLSNYEWKVEFEDTIDDNNYVYVSNVKIVDRNFDAVYNSDLTRDVCLNNGPKVVNIDTTEMSSKKVVTIYYNGYSNPYIHYQVGNGSWTKAPGFQMVTDASQSGYTHKYTINLGNESYANVCFNDGHGNWDSKNGQNYNFKAGTYLFKNGIIKEIQSIDSDFAVKNFSANDVDKTLYTNENLELTANGMNGIAPYKYKFGYVLDDKEVLGDYSSNNSATFNINSKCSIVPIVYIKDVTGKVVSKKYSNINVNKEFSMSDIHINPSSTISVGDTVTLTSDVDGSQGVSYCSWSIYKNEKRYSTAYSYGAYRNFEFHADTVGKYKAQVIAINEEKRKLVEKEISFYVSDSTNHCANIYAKDSTISTIHYSFDKKNWLTSSMKKSSLNGITLYNVSVKTNSQGIAYIYFTDNNGKVYNNNDNYYEVHNNSFIWSNGNLDELYNTGKPLSIDKFYYYKIGDEEINTNTKLNELVIKAGTSIGIDSSVSGGIKPYKSTISYIDENGKNNFISDGFFSNFKIYHGGWITPVITITDAIGNSVTKKLDKINIGKLSIDDLETNLNSPQNVNVLIQLSAKISNRAGSCEPYINVYLNNNLEEKVQLDNCGNGTWNPKKSGKYLLTCVAEDSQFQKSILKKEFTITEGDLSIVSFTCSASKEMNVTSTFELSAVASGGTAPYKYEFGYTKDGKVTSYITDDNNYYIYANQSGIITPFVKITDSKGQTITHTYDSITVINGLEVNDIKVTPASPQLVGTKLNIKADIIHGHTMYGRYSSVEYVIKKDGKVVTTLFDPYLKSSEWIPTEVGNYTITCNVSDVSGQSATKTVNFVVKEKNTTENIVTIYYKGYSTPYIHYQVENGSWTNAPGYKMYATSEMNGYTHKYTIDLGTTSYANVCFNDGHGDWDSQNGRNYHFEKGTYTFKDGVITPVIGDNKFGIESLDTSLSNGKVTVGQSFEISVKLKNATTQAVNKFTSVDEKGNETTIHDYANAYGCAWQFPNTGVYKIRVYSKESYNATDYVMAEKTITVLPNDDFKFTKTYADSESTVDAGYSFSVSADVTGGVAPYKYEFGYTKDGKVTSYTTDNNSYSFYPKEECTLTPFVKVTDATGKTISHTYNTVKVIKGLKVTDINVTPNSPQVVGTKLNIKADIINGRMKYGRFNLCEYVIKKDGKVVETLEDPYLTSAYWTPTEAGNYTITCNVSDISGQSATKTVNFVVKDKNISENVITIYYKGYSTPYIHYQVGNGSWTSAPGYKMSATNEKSGYTHKYTIILGTSTYANVCFNNGSGSWDSRNGQNYHFEKGTYTFSNGNMTKIAD